jgi:hypothetical protein
MQRFRMKPLSGLPPQRHEPQQLPVKRFQMKPLSGLSPQRHEP